MSKLTEAIARKYQTQTGLLDDRQKYLEVIKDNLDGKVPSPILRCLYDAITEYYHQDVVILNREIGLLEALREE